MERIDIYQEELVGRRRDSHRTLSCELEFVELLDLAAIRWLAANDLLERWEVGRLLNGAKAPDLAP